MYYNCAAHHLLSSEAAAKTACSLIRLVELRDVCAIKQMFFNLEKRNQPVLWDVWMISFFFQLRQTVIYTFVLQKTLGWDFHSMWFLQTGTLRDDEVKKPKIIYLIKYRTETLEKCLANCFQTCDVSPSWFLIETLRRGDPDRLTSWAGLMKVWWEDAAPHCSSSSPLQLQQKNYFL